MELPQTLGLKDFSPKDQDAVALRQIKERGALPMIDRGDIRQAMKPLQQYLGFTAGRWLWSGQTQAWQTWSGVQSGRNGQRLMYEQSHRDYLRSGYLHHRLPVIGLLIITVITPLPTKPSATKMLNWRSERDNY